MGSSSSTYYKKTAAGICKKGEGEASSHIPLTEAQEKIVIAAYRNLIVECIRINNDLNADLHAYVSKKLFYSLLRKFQKCLDILEISWNFFKVQKNCWNFKKFLEMSRNVLKFLDVVVELFRISRKFPKISWNLLKVLGFFLEFQEIYWNVLKTPENIVFSETWAALCPLTTIHTMQIKTTTVYSTLDGIFGGCQLRLWIMC